MSARADRVSRGTMERVREADATDVIHAGSAPVDLPGTPANWGRRVDVLPGDVTANVRS